MNNLKLLPCPFCGGRAVLEEHAAHKHSAAMKSLIPDIPDHPGSFTIECAKAGCNTGQIGDTREAVIAMWNRRTQPEATAPAQDLSAAILAIPLPEPEVHDAAGYRRAYTDSQMRDLLKAAAALASSANALSAGDRVDALDQISMIVDRDTPPDSRNEVIDHDIRGAPITRAMVERAGTWKRVRKPGQVSVGDKLRFTIGGKQQTKTAIKILHAGTNKEEVIYSTHKNFYFITSMVVDGTSTHKNVEFRAAILQSQKDNHG